MAKNTIFYSEVDTNLQKELDARGNSGKTRTTEDLNYMLGKVSNVQLRAYKTLSAKNKDDVANILYTLGGRTVIEGDFLSSNFLDSKRELIYRKTADASPLINKVSNKSYKIPPYIISCEITTNDGTAPILNSAIIRVNIPNVDLDLDFMESTFARPGRAMTLILEYPDNAVITSQRLQPTTLQTALNTKNVNNKMNRLEFDGLMFSFDMSYQPDGTVLLTLHLKGTSNVYVDTTMLINPESNPVDSNTTDLKDFYQILNDDLEFLKKNKLSEISEDGTIISGIVAEQQEVTVTAKRPTNLVVKNIKPVPVQVPLLSTKLDKSTRTDTAVLVSNQFKGQTETKRYMMLGRVVALINGYISKKNESVTPNPFIVCNEDYVQSYYYEDLVSAYPEDIFLMHHDQYGKINDKPNYFLTGKSRGIIPADFDYRSITDPKVCHPSKIFFNIEVILKIIKDLQKANSYTLKSFFAAIGDQIRKALGGAIDLILVPHPDDPSFLLFTNANYIGTEKVKPYSVPMFANHPNGTVVHEIKLDAKLPKEMQSLMYTVNNSGTVSEEQIAPYVSFMYNNAFITRRGNVQIIDNTESQRIIKKLEEDYKANHEKYKQQLEDNKQKLGQSWLSEQNASNLESAIKKYLQHPADSIKKSNQMQAPVYPYEVEFKIDGINGFRWGNVLEFDALPTKYKNGTTFTITSIVHNVDTAGLWTTVIKCKMRAKI